MTSPGDGACDSAGDSETDKRARAESSVVNPLQRYAPPVNDGETLFAACERPFPFVVCANTIKVTVVYARGALNDEGVTCKPTDWHPGTLELEDSSPGMNWPYLHGWLRGQEEVSALPATALDPQPGEHV